MDNKNASKSFSNLYLYDMLKFNFPEIYFILYLVFLFVLSSQLVQKAQSSVLNQNVITSRALMWPITTFLHSKY